jgi:hypothetical protein
MQETVKINRIDLNKNGKSVTLTFGQTAVSKDGTVDSDNKVTIHRAPHDDLANAFLRMVPHVLWITQLRPERLVSEDFFNDFGFTNDADFNGINVTGVAISGKDDDFVQILATKTTSRLEVIAINTPKIWLGDESTKAYSHLNILSKHVDEARKEANKFYKGKYKPELQETLPL